MIARRSPRRLRAFSAKRSLECYLILIVFSCPSQRCEHGCSLRQVPEVVLGVLPLDRGPRYEDVAAAAMCCTSVNWLTLPPPPRLLACDLYVLHARHMHPCAWDVHFACCALHCTLRGVRCAVCSVRCAVCGVLCALVGGIMTLVALFLVFLFWYVCVDFWWRDHRGGKVSYIRWPGRDDAFQSAHCRSVVSAVGGAGQHQADGTLGGNACCNAWRQS